MTNELFRQSRQTLIDYLEMKVRMSDWHGVSDAANDLRELEARQAGVTEGVESTTIIMKGRR